HWQQAVGRGSSPYLNLACDRFRLTGGNIRRAARLATTSANLAGREQIELADIQEATRLLNHQVLDMLATRLTTEGDWNSLAIRNETMRELQNLERRCSHRERLCDSVSALPAQQMNSGVRALFNGPSGTGKTLAARVVASILRKDLYRLDLSSVVNKYIGETEKNLSRLFARAE